VAHVRSRTNAASLARDSSGPIWFGLRPLLGDGEELGPDVRHEREHERGDVVEVAVEDRSGVTRPRHQRVDAQLAERLLAQAGLRGVEDLAAVCSRSCRRLVRWTATLIAFTINDPSR